MNWLERFILWIASRRPAEQVSPLTTLMGESRQAQYEENYDESLRLLQQADTLATEKRDVTAQVDILLSKADNFIHLRRYQEAETLLLDLRQRAEAASHRAPLAYALCSLGVLKQVNGSDADARTYFERALQVARGVRATGAEARASGHLADIYLREGNASYALHLLREALPRLHTSGDTELVPYFMMQMAETLFIIGNAPEGDSTLQKALEQAAETQHRRYIRQAHLKLGQRAVETGNYTAARTHYNEALALFTDSLKHTPDYVRALVQSGEVMLAQGEAEPAAKQAQQALDLAEAMTIPAVTAQAQALNGMALNALNQPAKALPHLEQAVAFYAQRPPDRDYLEMIRSLAAVQAATGDTESAMTLYRQAVDTAAAAGLRLASAEAAADSGRLHERRRHLKDALAQYTEALKIYEELNEPGHIARMHCTIGALREQMGQGRRGIKDYEQALTRLSSVNDAAVRGAVLAEVALAYTDYGDIDSAENFFGQALDYARQMGDRAAEAERRTHYGRFLVLIGDAKPAMTALMDAVAFSQAHHQPLLMALQSDGLASASRLTGELPPALYHHQQALKNLESLDEPLWQSVCQINQAHTFVALNRHAEAARLFEAALHIGRTKQYPQVIISGLCGLAKQDLLNGLSEPAGTKLDEAAALVGQSYSKRLLADVCLLQSHYHMLVGDSAAADEKWQEAEKLMKLLRMPFSRPEWLPRQA